MNPLKWHGGKTYLAKWIISNFPDRDSYTHYLEAYAGGLAVLFEHDPTNKSETINDINSGLMDFWFVLAKTPDRMLRELWATPLSDTVWDAAICGLSDNDRVRRATSFFIRYRQSRQGLGKNYCTPTSRIRRGMNENVSSWLSAIECLPEAHDRLKRVEVRNMPAIDFIRTYDHVNALFYLDPTYMPETRVSKNSYEFEMSVSDHRILLDMLIGLKGKFMLSGYHSNMYDEWALSNNIRFVEYEIDNKASSKSSKDKKIECLWMNY